MIRDRIGISNEYYKYAEPCDLCDEMNFPQIGWCCEHDDPAHGTNICLECLKQLYKEHYRKEK